MPRLRPLFVALCLLLLLAVVLCGAPGVARAADPTLTPAATFGPLGATFAFAGAGFTPGQSYDAAVACEGGQTLTASGLADDQGNFPVTFVATAVGGCVVAVNGPEGTFTALVAVTQATIGVGPATASDATMVQAPIVGTGYAANTAYRFSLTDPSGTVQVDTTLTSDDAGNLVFTTYTTPDNVQLATNVVTVSFTAP
jgi:hypothetical protein